MAESGRPCPSCATPVPTDVLSCPSCGAISLPSAGDDAQAGIALRLSQALGQRYRVERELGRGGMAVVFLAHDLRHDRPVAIKVLLPELSRFLGLERFLREIHIAAQLNHPHILPLHDSGEADGLLFYVMPYVEGDSLRRRLAREGPLPVAEAVRIAAEVADGLSYAHHLGVVHRDIKPENILLTQSHAVIADFGIARAVAGAGPGATITTVGISLGTPNYMSPEQAAADPALDHRTDLYALGCTLYEMLTGRPPYPGPTPQALAAQHLTEPVPEPRARRREVPAALDVAVRRAMAKSAAGRFQTAAEFGAALGGLPVATGPGVSYPDRQRVWRWRAAAGVAAVVVVAGGAALLVGRGQGWPPPAVRPPLGVVVRYIEDRSGGLQATADRITEALTDRLQAVPALHVAASAVVAGLRHAPLDSLRSRFAPDRFVVGHLEAVGDSLRVSVEIVDPATDRAEADTTATVSRRANVETELAEPISVFVRQVFWRDLVLQERHARVRSAAAWALVEQAAVRRTDAEQAIGERRDRQGFRWLDLADSLLREARRLDGASDLIPMDLARIAESRAFYAEYLVQQFSETPAGLPDPATEHARALSQLDELIRRRHGPAEAYELRGQVKEGLYRALGADSLLDGAIADYQAATERDRRLASAWQALASTFSSKGQYADAGLAIQHAIDQDVFRLARRNLLRSQFDAALRASRNDLAEAACRTGVAEAPDDERFRDCEVELWSRTRGDRRTAAAARARSDTLAALDSGSLSAARRELWVAEILANAGLGESADALARRATADAPAAWQPLLLAELIYLRVLRRDLDSALALTRLAIRADPTLRRYVERVPWLAPLRSDPRFAAAARQRPTPP
jgi:hypothetical protein